MVQPRILVVEDNPALLEIMTDILEQEGYAVDAVADGVQALKALEAVLPDLIASDVMMPGMDGYDLYRRVRARPEWNAIPFIFVTAKSEKDDVLRGKSLGVEDYIVKPFTSEELTAAIGSRLKRAQAIRQAVENEFDQLKQEITRVLSHELRTPLTWILGYSQLGLDAAGSLSPQEFQEYLEVIKRGAERLNQLVEDSLLLVQLDLGHAAETYRRHVQLRDDLASIIENLAAALAEQATSQGLAIGLELPAELPPVNLYEHYFSDALRRLVDNAIKFSKGTGHEVIIRAASTRDWVDVTVADQGVGMSGQELSHLFERFHQFNRDKAEQQGAGLGLSLALGLVRLHGGEILVESAPGRGSAFTIRLPSAGEARSRLDEDVAGALTARADDIVRTYAATLAEADPALASELDEPEGPLGRADVTRLIQCLGEALANADPAVFAQCVQRLDLAQSLGSPIAVRLAWILLKQSIARYLDPAHARLTLEFFDRGRATAVPGA